MEVNICSGLNITCQTFDCLVQAEALARALEEKNLPARVYVGMRYWHPFTEEAIEQVSEKGAEGLRFR